MVGSGGTLGSLPDSGSSLACGLTPRGSAAGGLPAASEFYVPLSATGGLHRTEFGICRARQLQPLVRRYPAAISGLPFGETTPCGADGG